MYNKCVKPPSKFELAKMLETEAGKRNILLGMDGDHMPDIEWMQLALSSLNPKHAIFEKSYNPHARPSSTGQKMMVDNRDQFFTGLPMLSSKEMKGKSMVNRTQQ